MPEPAYELAPHLLGGEGGFRERLAAAGLTVLADNTGVGGSVPGCTRRDDTFGIGWYHASTSSRIGTRITSQFGPIGDGQGVECCSTYALTPAIRITPDVQYVVPALRAAEPAFIAGVRALVSF